MIFGTATATFLAAALFLAAPRLATAAVGVSPEAATSANPSPGAAIATTPSLPSGVSEVMKLFRGGITADIIANYVNNSTLSFYLNADNIIFLQQQGLPASVLTAMIQRYGELQRQTAIAARAAAPVPVPAQAPAPRYYAYSAEDQATANFNAALQARAAASAAYVAPPTYPVYAPAAPAYYDYDPFYYDSFYSPWYPFGGPVVFDFGVGYGGRFAHGGFGHGGIVGHGGGFGGIGGHGGGGGHR